MALASPERVSPRILSLERVDNLATSVSARVSARILLGTVSKTSRRVLSGLKTRGEAKSLKT